MVPVVYLLTLGLQVYKEYLLWEPEVRKTDLYAVLAPGLRKNAPDLISSAEEPSSDQGGDRAGEVLGALRLPASRFM